MTAFLWIAAQAFILAVGFGALAFTYAEMTDHHRRIIRIIKGMDQ